MSFAQALTELLEPENRKRIEYGVPAGYAITAGIVAIGLMFYRIGLLPHAREMILMLAPLKLVTNTLMWAALKKDRHILPAAALNLFADTIVLTGIVYYTGASSSPVISLYFIVLAITATLSNIVVTVVTAAAMLVAYSTMLSLIAMDVLRLYPPFLAIVYEQGKVSPAFVVIDTLRVLFMLAILVVAMGSTMQQLQRQQRELRQKNHELEEASRLKSEFVANITHELRTPIHGVLGLTEMLEEGIYGPVTDRQNKALTGIRTSADNLLHMVDDLLSFERVNTGRLSIRAVGVDLTEVLANVRQTGDWIRGKKQLDIRVTGPALWLHASDQAVLQHILTNLVANAVKFTPEGGTITLGAELEGDVAAIHVTDTGVGIPPEHLEKIWQPFRQVDGSSSREFGGVGLGLAVVLRLTEMLDGKVGVESGTTGTTFTVRIPNATLKL